MTDRRTCPLCRAGMLVRMFPDAHDWLVRCRACGLGLADPQPTDAELAAIYDADYYQQFGYAAGPAAEALARIKRATYARMLRQAGRWRDLPARPGAPGARGQSLPRSRQVGMALQRRPRLLDVGCGLGYSLAAARDRGWDAFGLEPHAMGGRGLEGTPLAGRVAHATLEDYRPPEPFDLVSLVDVIEHVRDPLATIRQAARLIRPGGLLLLATNNVQSRQARRLGPRWVHFHRAHLWYFSPATLAAVARAGQEDSADRRDAGLKPVPHGQDAHAACDAGWKPVMQGRDTHVACDAGLPPVVRGQVDCGDLPGRDAHVAGGLGVLRVEQAWRVYNLQYVASILAGGGNFGLARRLARLSLRLTPRPLRLASWPPLPEGMVLLARR